MSLQSETIELQIVQAIPGRIHLKISRLRRNPGYGDQLQRLVQSLNPVTHVWVNPASGSMIVHYNPRSIENKIMQRVLTVCVWQADSQEAMRQHSQSENETLSKIEAVKIQQLFSELKVNAKLRNRSQELGLTPEKVDELLELVEVNVRVSSDRLWLSVHL